MSFEFLIAPLRMLISALGTGELPAGGPVSTLAASRSALDQAAGLARGVAAEASAGWQGRGGLAAGARATTSAADASTTGSDGADIAALVQSAAARVKQANTELNALADGFVAAANTAAPTMTPAALLALVPIAAEHVGRGLGVVNRTQSELAADAEGLTRYQAPAEVAAVGTAGAGPDSGASAVPASDPATSDPAASDPAASAAPGRVPITLPDGSVSYAPNERAAKAVQAALSQRGVPYVWGGTTPSGFDCSGLTQWSYRQAGLEIPRLAQEQDTAGFAVTQSQLQPGDLAVWSGHVAMYVGNGQMVEAGDPVQVGPVRTTNLDQTFEGFYRPR
ncbi:MAG: NlpC/P60 family protein [Gordonia sp. (in: high G+C Gram-positive bacteria)]|uniref:NlpC/P60 family protein n=1 Tax=Gordonia sp. (in: high G+C Gram-positive bacteria) TaxID=84139 RepID=UPI0039E5109E